MATAPRDTVVTDTSVLINFLVLDRVDLLAQLPQYVFVVTEHVRAEITQHYPNQLARLESALQQQTLQEIRVTDLQELALFAQLTTLGLGVGECSALAVAINRQCPIAIDDKTARKRALRQQASLRLLSTESLVVDLIHADVLTVPAADVMKSEWDQKYRFRLPFGSFAERI